MEGLKVLNISLLSPQKSDSYLVKSATLMFGFFF